MLIRWWGGGNTINRLLNKSGKTRIHSESALFEQPFVVKHFLTARNIIISVLIGWTVFIECFEFRNLSQTLILHFR